jgi:hypothetical protein
MALVLVVTVVMELAVRQEPLMVRLQVPIQVKPVLTLCQTKVPEAMYICGMYMAAGQVDLQDNTQSEALLKVD